MGAFLNAAEIVIPWTSMPVVGREADRQTGRQVLCSGICIRYSALEVVLNPTRCVLISGCKSWVLCTIDSFSESPNKWSRIHQGLLWLDGCLWETTHQVDLTVTHFTLPGWRLSHELRQTQDLPGRWGQCFRKHFLELWHYVCRWIMCCLSQRR